MTRIKSSSGFPGGVWSAAPTPFTSKMDIDLVSIKRMIKHHIRLGVNGLFLAGTNGEGQLMTNRQHGIRGCYRICHRQEGSR